MKDYRDGGTRGRVHTEDRLVFSAAVWLTYAELPISQFHPMQMTRDRTIATSDVHGANGNFGIESVARPFQPVFGFEYFAFQIAAVIHSTRAETHA